MARARGRERGGGGGGGWGNHMVFRRSGAGSVANRVLRAGGL